MRGLLRRFWALFKRPSQRPQDDDGWVSVQSLPPAELGRLGFRTESPDGYERRRMMEREFSLLDARHPGWRSIVGDPHEDVPFRIWLRAQSPAYQETINYSMSAEVIGDAIDSFKAQRAKVLH